MVARGLVDNGRRRKEPKEGDGRGEVEVEEEGPAEVERVEEGEAPDGECDLDPPSGGVFAPPAPAPPANNPFLLLQKLPMPVAKLAAPVLATSTPANSAVPTGSSPPPPSPSVPGAQLTLLRFSHSLCRRLRSLRRKLYAEERDSDPWLTAAEMASRVGARFSLRCRSCKPAARRIPTSSIGLVLPSIGCL